MTERTLIDAKDLILGRLCSNIATRLLHGEEIDVINAELSILTGKRESIFARYRHFRDMTRPSSGPFFKRSSRDIFKRTVKKMLPYKRTRGQEALKRIKIYKNVPERFKGKKAETIPTANVSKVPNLKYLQLKEVTKFLGGK